MKDAIIIIATGFFLEKQNPFYHLYVKKITNENSSYFIRIVKSLSCCISGQHESFECQSKDL